VTETSGPPTEPERVQKALARAGLGSRRACETLIREGRVTINGEEATLGNRVDPVRDRVEVDGVVVPLDPGLVYYALNKPAGVVTTARDPQGRPDVSRFYPRGARVFPVGRLDRDTEGLIILTNDGELANRLTHPRFGAEKEYLAEVQGDVGDRLLRRLERGVELDDGVAHAKGARLAASSGGRTAVRLIMTEGRKREVRRMLSAVGLEVLRLVRLRMGSLRLKDLPPGSVRELEPEEVRDLYRHVEPGLRSRAERRRAT
jgi:23S rRNA pseudouridine2605 synthase